MFSASVKKIKFGFLFSGIPLLCFLVFLHTESYVLGINHQFLVENVDSDRLIDLLSERNCITEEERSHLNNQPYNFFKNEALIYWMRAINYQQDKGLKVLECLREAGQRFVLALLLEGGGNNLD